MMRLTGEAEALTTAAEGQRQGRAGFRRRRDRHQPDAGNRDAGAIADGSRCRGD